MKGFTIIAKGKRKGQGVPRALSHGGVEAVRAYARQMPDVGTAVQSIAQKFGAAGYAVDADDWAAAERDLEQALSELRSLTGEVDRATPPPEMSAVHQALRRALRLHRDALTGMRQAAADENTADYLEEMKTYLSGSQELVKANQHLGEWQAQHNS